jgi:hypothetical protein
MPSQRTSLSLISDCNSTRSVPKFSHLRAEQTSEIDQEDIVLGRLTNLRQVLEFRAGLGGQRSAFDSLGYCRPGFLDTPSIVVRH